MRASYGSLQLLGIKPGDYNFTPRAIYLLIGDACEGGCLFCPQSSGNPERLSRVTWPEVDQADIIKAIGKANLNRICIQATRSSATKADVIAFLKLALPLTCAPISVSMHIETLSDARDLFEAGAANISIALDTATEELSKRIKNKPLQPSINLLKEIAKFFPGQVTTHLIAGLGETQEQIVELARDLIKSDVVVSLFAFTPIPGTPLENLQPPDLKPYRQVQTALALIRKNHDWKIDYKNGQIQNLGDYEGQVTPQDYQNPGCKGCNRPYYNEKPGGILYNHPNPPDMEQILKELK
ncbi:MAG: radical SAM protein [Caldisericia bacterium]|nr:radical SAM protein [Caldisericia bacterium]